MDDEQFTSGIYNFCDRWCERCSMTAKCRLFADQQKENEGDHDAREPKDGQFWEQVKWNLERTRALLEGYLEKEGVTLSQDDLEEAERREKKAEAEVNGHPLNGSAHDYALEVNTWFKGRKGLFGSVQADLNAAARLELPGDDPAETAARINEAVEVIRWYHIQIAAKVNRALASKLEDADDENLAELPSDADGSAKVALLGIDASLASWGVLRNYFDDIETSRTKDTEADVIIDLMVHLDKIRRGTEQEFPKARAFVRPGFDDRVGD